MLDENELTRLLKSISENFNPSSGRIYLRKTLTDIDPEQMKRLLEHCQSLKATIFDFSNNDFTPEIIAYLFEFMRYYPHAEITPVDIRLTSNQLNTPIVYNAITHFFASNYGKWRISLDKLHIKHLPKSLLDSIIQNTSVIELCLKNVDITHDQNLPQPKHTLDLLFHNKHIEVLNLNHIGYLNNDDFEDIANGLENNQTITQFNINIVPRKFALEIRLKATQAFMRAVTHNTGALKHIALKADAALFPPPKNGGAKVPLTADDTSDLINPRIQSLTLDNFHIKPNFIEKILTVNFPNLKSLELRHCTLSDETLCKLATLLNSLELEKIYLETVDLLEKGQAALLNALADNQTVSECYLSDALSFAIINLNKAARAVKHPEVIAALKNVFQRNTCLEILDLRGCNVFDEETHADLIAVLEKYNRTLATILNHEPRTLEKCHQLDINKAINNEKRRLTSLYAIQNEIKNNKLKEGKHHKLYEYILTQYILELSKNDPKNNPPPPTNIKLEMYTQRFFNSLDDLRKTKDLSRYIQENGMHDEKSIAAAKAIIADKSCSISLKNICYGLLSENLRAEAEEKSAYLASLTPSKRQREV
ncbi:MAG: hypothetical protein SFW66_05795 [Gammaproteobacteria bacterium]|nr:hypothetical protein [Gammaproteobacteria bacterium]